MVTSEMLAKLELFEGLPEEALRSIAAFCDQASFEPQRTILLMQYLTQNPAVGFVVMQRVAQVMSQRLGAMRKLLIETIIDCDRPASALAEN
jgi:hypothetical protein